MAGSNSYRRGTIAWRVSLVTITVSVLFTLAYVRQGSELRAGVEKLLSLAADEETGIVPQELLRLNVYSMQDFSAVDHRAPPYWSCNDKRNACNRTDLWGPCYSPTRHVAWSNQVQSVRAVNRTIVAYHDKSISNSGDLTDYCKPGFLIIGAGKCGTSSLYHYITQHPRVLPASEKQIHYFKYYYDFPMKWYLKHFPTATNFLANGALMTGEASPGYLPYPDVVHRIRTKMPGPRILAIGRNPLDRAYSSYRYNYVTPTLEEMKKGHVSNVPPNKDEAFYRQFLFSFQDMMEAELKQLRKCLDATTGRAVVEAQDQWSKYTWAKQEVNRRKQLKLPPLADLDGFCYGSGNDTVPREQWADLMAKYPEKVITNKNLHLQQSFIGRSLYTLPLEWWYVGLPKEDIYFLCTEDMKDFSGSSFENLSRFLGLPSFNFSTVLQEGAYNVGGHRGYDKEVSWEEMAKENATIDSDRIPLTDELRREVLSFIQPYNERLFDLVGRRCPWY